MKDVGMCWPWVLFVGYYKTVNYWSLYILKISYLVSWIVSQQAETISHYFC